MLSGLRKSLIVSQLVLCGISSAVVADEAKWRLSKMSDTLMLYTADTDEGTDALGSLHFQCKVGSGLVEVAKDIQDKSERAAIGKLVLDDSYPTVELSPGPETSSLDAITMSDASGWGYRFQISPDAAAFDLFKKTGTFKFKIGSAAIQYGIKAGLDKIAQFQSACRRPSDRPKASK
jgi:hypothetical protein